ncbi:MAG: PAQR family membrane homeostasis protein TrhA [Breznakibacter sp.]
MHKNQPLKFYSPLEEKINVISHCVGFFLSLVALVFLIDKSLDSFLRLISFSVFGVSLIVLYAASSLYHASKDEEIRKKRRVWDHSAIYVLIAGTYTPFTLVAMHGKTGWILFAVNWSMALGGIILKLFFTGRFGILSTIFYLVMGWSVVFAIKPLMEALSPDGLFWLAAGGVAYTLGAILYSIKGLNYTHALFHILVLIGSFCHFVSIYFYI